MSKVSALYHVVFCTKRREMTIPNSESEHLYRFIWNILKEKRCNLYRINGIPNHLHLLIDLNPEVALSWLIRDIKSQSSGWMSNDARFPEFSGWAREYFAATVSYKDKDAVIEYIKSQREHHNCIDFNSELKQICNQEGLLLFKDDLI